MDTKRLSNAFRSHKAKNYTNAYMSAPSHAEQEAKASGDLKKALDAFTDEQAKQHQYFNDLKNNSLYVSYENGKFTSPKDVVSQAIRGRDAGSE